LDLDESKKSELKQQLDEMFKKAKPLFRGYVDDRRNTDNAWMETECVSIHDDTGDLFQLFPLSSGDDAVDVCWVE
jgi:ADP-ribose pyrophosphatase